MKESLIYCKLLYSTAQLIDSNPSATDGNGSSREPTLAERTHASHAASARAPPTARPDDLSSIAEESLRAASSLPSAPRASPMVPPPSERLAQASPAPPLKPQQTGVSTRSRRPSFVLFNQPNSASVQAQTTGIQRQVTGVQPQLTGLQLQAEGVQAQNASLQPQATGIQPQPTGEVMRPQYTGMQSQRTGLQPQLTGPPPPPIASAPMPSHSPGLQPQRTGLQPHPTGPPLQSQRTGGSTFQLPSAMKAQKTGVSLHPNPAGVRSPVPPAPSHEASMSDRPLLATTPVPAPSQRSGSILLNPGAPPQPVPAQYTGPVHPQPTEERPTPFLQQQPGSVPPMQAQRTGPRCPASMYAGTPAPPGFSMPRMPGAWGPSTPMPLGASKTGPVREPPPLQATRTGWAPGHARQRSRETMWTQPMEHHRTLSDNRFDNWHASHSAARSAQAQAALGLGIPLAPLETGVPQNSLQLTGVPMQERQRSVSIAPSHPDVIRRRSERGYRRL